MTERILIADQIAEVGRELGLRRNVYPAFVARGKMSQDEADLHLARLEAAYATLKWVRDHRDELVAIHGGSAPPPADPA
jgi:hypothetical protein